MDEKILFVFNPFAGKGYIKNRLFGIVDTFVKCGCEVSVYPTQGAGDARRVVFERGGEFDSVVLAGGDGTLNEGIRGVMQLPLEVRPNIGYIPAGTTNDFAANFGISKNAVKAAQRIADGDIFKCDVGRFAKENFIYVAAFGAFTDVAYGTPQQYKNMLGQTAYLLEGIKRLHTLKSYHVKVEHDGVCTEDEFIFGMVSNTNHIGGFSTERAFRAQLNDGLFEVVLIKRPKSIVALQDLIAHIVIKDFASDLFEVFSAENVTFESEAPISWTLDGEFGGEYKFADISIEKEAVSLLL